jgi:hypothetical protein
VGTAETGFEENETLEGMMNSPKSINFNSTGTEIR